MGFLCVMENSHIIITLWYPSRPPFQMSRKSNFKKKKFYFLQRLILCSPFFEELEKTQNFNEKWGRKEKYFVLHERVCWWDLQSFEEDSFEIYETTKNLFEGEKNKKFLNSCDENFSFKCQGWSCSFCGILFCFCKTF